MTDSSDLLPPLFDLKDAKTTLLKQVLRGGNGIAGGHYDKLEGALTLLIVDATTPRDVCYIYDNVAVLLDDNDEVVGIRVEGVLDDPFHVRPLGIVFYDLTVAAAAIVVFLEGYIEVF